MDVDGRDDDDKRQVAAASDDTEAQTHAVTAAQSSASGSSMSLGSSNDDAAAAVDDAVAAAAGTASTHAATTATPARPTAHTGSTMTPSAAEAAAATARTDTPTSQPVIRPSIPDDYLRSVIHPLATADCSNKTFKNILTIIEHLSHLHGARDVFLGALAKAADDICPAVVEDLLELERVLARTPSTSSGAPTASSGAPTTSSGAPSTSSGVTTTTVTSPPTPSTTSPQHEIDVQRVTLQRFSPADSSQARLLRVVKTIDYIHTKRRTIAQTGGAGASSSDNHLPSMRGGRGGGVANMVAEMFGGGAHALGMGRSGGMASAGASEESLGQVISNLAKRSPSLDDLVSQFDKPAYKEVWLKLNACLLRVQQDPSMVFVATVLLPLIECLMIVCKYLMAFKERNVAAASGALSPTLVRPRSPITTGSFQSLAELFAAQAVGPVSTTEDTSATASQQPHRQPHHHFTGDELFFIFTERHRKILNTLVQAKPNLLRGSFSLLIRNPKVLEFDSKRMYFHQQLHSKAREHRGNVVNVNVRRQYIFQDSYYQLQSRSGDELKYGKLSVRFHDEEAADYGGVSREWFQELTKEMFNANYALFTPSAEKMGVTYQPNPTSWVNPSHLLYFKFVGRIIGKAIYDGLLLDCYFTRSVYKHILGKPVDMSDMDAIDPEYHKSLKWILENSIDDVLDLTFSTEMDEFGQQKVVDLKPNGRDIPVTDENKHEYVALMVENRLTTAIRDQIHAFLAGFHDIIPKDLVSVFNEKELELLISGVPDIDIDDWRNNTDYRGYTSGSAQVQWFWRAVRSFDQEERAKLLQFTTGTSKVPLEGFAHLQGIGGKQKFQIHKDFGKTNRLPSAHTCFNQIDLPMYESYEQLKERLLISINEAATGFGFE